MLGREKLILRRERAGDRADVQEPPIGRGDQIHGFRQIGEGHERLGLRQRWDGPLREAQDTKSRYRQSASENLSPGTWIRHDSFPFSWPFSLPSTDRMVTILLHCSGRQAASGVLPNWRE